MMYPSKDDYLRGSPQPLTLMMPAPPSDVFELYRRILRPGLPSFLFESGGVSHRTARYSFFGDNPYAILTGSPQGTVFESNGSASHLQRPAFDQLFDLLDDSPITARRGLPPFYGGAVGYLSYDWVRMIESVPALAQDDLGLPLVQFAFVDLVAALDHADHQVYLMYCPPRSRFRSEPREKLYREGCDRLAEFEARLTGPPCPWQLTPNSPAEFLPDQSRAAYTDRVRRCQDYIAAGDIYQANLSHRFTIRTALTAASYVRDPLPLMQYGRLRTINPSPFSACLCFENVALVSSSPERLVRLSGRRADTRPIAGTRPRGKTVEEDRRLLAELSANSKERAEHLMLVDLERNDLGRVCRYGSVRVEDFMTIEQYSHVSHLVSNVAGELRSDVSGRDLIKAVFPGGTAYRKSVAWKSSKNWNPHGAALTPGHWATSAGAVTWISTF